MDEPYDQGGNPVNTVTLLAPTLCWGLLAGLWCRGRITRIVPPVPVATNPAADVHRPPLSFGDTDRRKLAGLTLAGTALLAVVIHPIVAPAAPLALFVGPRLRERRLRRRNYAVVVDQLPDLVDLLRLTTLAGLPVSTALMAIDGLPGGPLGPVLRRAVGQLRHGAPVARALHVLGDHGGPPVQPLVDVLVDHDRYGTPLGPALDRVGIEARLHRRRAAEEAARRLPVTLLFPLVFTTLPACGLLTVIPLLVASLSSLQP